jgi:hypothetical protein
MNKKAQGMPLNTIVIAAIVLVVMVVLILIFTGRMGKTSQDLQTCQAQGGKCVTKGLCDPTIGEKLIEETSDCETNEECCITLRDI